MKAVIAFLCLFTISAVQAQDIYRNDINAMLFAKLTFDGHRSASKDDSLKFGLSVNNTHTVLTRTNRLNLTGDHSYQRSLLDIEVSSRTKYFSKFTLGGVDALTYRTTYNYYGEAIKWPMGLNTDEIFGIAIIAGGAAYYAYGN